MEKSFFSNFIKFTTRCFHFVLILTKDLGEVILVHHYDLFLPNFGGNVSTADSSQIKQANIYCFAFQLFFLYFGLNLRHKWMQQLLSAQTLITFVTVPLTECFLPITRILTAY